MPLGDEKPVPADGHMVVNGIRLLLLAGLLVHAWRGSCLSATRDGRNAVLGGFLLLLLAEIGNWAGPPLALPAPLIDGLSDILDVAGIALLAWGIRRWLPSAQSSSRQADAREAALEESEQRLAAITENLPGIICRRVHRADGSIEFPYLGGNLRELLGIEPADVMTAPQILLDCLHPEDRLAFLGLDQPGEMAATQDLRAHAPDGRVLWLRSSFRCVRRNGREAVWDGLLLDVTQQKQARLQAVKAEQRLLDALEAIEAGFAIYDADDRLAVCNSRFRRLIPTAGGPTLGTHFTEVVRSGVAAGLYVGTDANPEAFVAHRLALHRSHRSPFELELTDGRWIQISEHDTREGGIVAVVAEVTDRKERERRLAESGARLAVTIAHMADGVVMFDDGLGLLICNQRWREMFALPSHLTTRGTSLAAILQFQAERGDFGPGKTDELVRHRLELANPAHSFLLHWTRSDRRVVEIRGNPLPGGGLVLTCNDVTVHKRAEDAMRAAKEAAEESTRAKSDFLANMSHELRTPLNAIIGFGEVMDIEMFGPLGARYHDYVGNILESARHLLNLINDVLDLSKVEAGQLELDEEHVAPVAAILSCLPMVASRAERNGCRLSADLPDLLPELWADPRRLKQILLNLLSNAVKFSGAGSVVTVRAALAKDGGLNIVIADQGIGIAAHEIPRILENWGQARSDRARQNEGTGLGLPLAKRLMELHGGNLRVESTLGKGTTVTLRFPPDRVLTPQLSPPADQISVPN